VGSGLGLHRAQCGIIPSNAASLAVAERVGFRREGLARRYLKINARWQDHVLLAVTLEDREGSLDSACPSAP
jgi:ribosomal-protein-alanine N-acetyltransferase